MAGRSLFTSLVHRAIFGESEPDDAAAQPKIALDNTYGYLMYPRGEISPIGWSVRKKLDSATTGYSLLQVAYVYAGADSDITASCLPVRRETALPRLVVIEKRGHASFQLDMMRIGAWYCLCGESSAYIAFALDTAAVGEGVSGALFDWYNVHVDPAAPETPVSHHLILTWRPGTAGSGYTLWSSVDALFYRFYACHCKTPGVLHHTYKGFRQENLPWSRVEATVAVRGTAARMDALVAYLHRVPEIETVSVVVQ